MSSSAARDPFTAAHWNGQVHVVVYPPAHGPPSVAAQARALFGLDLAPPEWAELVGAPDGATVAVASELADGEPVVLIRVSHPWYDGTAVRIVFRDEMGRTAMKNEVFAVRPEAPDGVGARVLAHQARKASALGVAYLEAEAAGGPGSTYVGYLVWPRLGFDGEIPHTPRRKLDLLPTDHPLRGALTVLDLITRPGGREWWRVNGTSFHGTSTSLRAVAPGVRLPRILRRGASSCE